MIEFVKIFGFDLKEYDQWQINWAQEDQWLIIISLGLMAPLALWFFWASLRRIGSTPNKIFLFSLRIFAFVFLLMILLRPELEFRKSHSLKNHIAVLLDNSKSLSIKTFPKEIARIDLVKKTLESNQEYLKQLKNKFHIDTYFISDGIKKTIYFLILQSVRFFRTHPDRYFPLYILRPCRIHLKLLFVLTCGIHQFSGYIWYI